MRRRRYGLGDNIRVDDANAAGLAALRTCFQRASEARGVGGGEQLKYLNLLMELDRLLGDSRDLDLRYRHDLSVLRANGLDKLILVGGSGVVRTTMLSGRRESARQLLPLWIGTVLAVQDTDTILAFAQQEIAKKRFWTSAAFREGLRERLLQAIALARESFGNLSKPTQSHERRMAGLNQLMEGTLKDEVRSAGPEAGEHSQPCGGVGSDPNTNILDRASSYTYCD